VEFDFCSVDVYVMMAEPGTIGGQTGKAQFRRRASVVPS